MNGSNDIPLVHSSTPDTKPCGLTSIIPTLGMSSCRGRAEAFARSLSSKLRTLGSQGDDPTTPEEDEPIINGGSHNTWMTSHSSEQTVTDIQPSRHESDSFFDFDCELESPGSPVDECEYLRLIETASNTPHTSAAESGYVCASAASSQSSSDGPYYDVQSPENLQNEIQSRISLPAAELPQYVNSLKLNGNATREERLSNGHSNDDTDTEECAMQHDPEHLVPNAKARMGITITETSPDKENLEECVVEKENCAECDEMLTAIGMAKVQNEIIIELQKQCEQFSEGNTALTKTKDDPECMTPTNCEDVTEPLELADQTSCHCTGETSNYTKVEIVYPSDSAGTIRLTSSDVTLTVTNGHSEVNDEVLNIETTETESSTEKGQDDVDCAIKFQMKPDRTADNESRNHSNESPEDQSEETKKIVVTVETKESCCTHLSVIDTTDDEDDCRPQRVRRCSSLKTGKTPPGTPGRKKIVRFADVLGLDLADIKTFLDEIPTIPKSAFEDLEMMDSEPPLQLGPKVNKLLMPLFQQPGGMTTFLDLVREKQVSLENAAITDPINQLITGSVRVRNLDFHKSVHIRYTLDNWRSYADLQANYVPNSCDGFSDKYSFVLFGNSLQVGQRLEFAVRFQCKGQQFWDNNYGTNYCFQCLPASGPAISAVQAIVPSHHTSCQAVEQLSPSVGEAWCSSFY